MAYGDRLASGQKSAVFGGPKVTQAKWEEIFGKTEPKKTKKT